MIVPYMIDDLLNNPHKYETNHNTFLTDKEYWNIFEETVGNIYAG